MFDELRNIDEGLYVNDMVRPQENMAFDRENIAAQLRMAFSQEEHGEGDSFEEEERNQKEEGEDEGAIGRLKGKEAEDEAEINLGLNDDAVKLLKGELLGEKIAKGGKKEVQESRKPRKHSKQLLRHCQVRLRSYPKLLM